MQVLPVSIFSFQSGWRNKLTIGSIGIGNITSLATFNRSTASHAPKRRYKANTKRCAAEDVLLRTFCSLLAQGLGGWYARIVNVEYFGEGVTCFLNKSRNENSINH